MFSSLKVECDYLDDLHYGKVTHDGVSYGDKANYSCDYGYKLVGESVRKCLHNGDWSGEKPKCEKSKLNEVLSSSDDIQLCNDIYISP